MANGRGKTECYHKPVQATPLSRAWDTLKARHTIVKHFMFKKTPEFPPKSSEYLHSASFWFPGIRNMNIVFSPENLTNQTHILFSSPAPESKPAKSICPGNLSPNEPIRTELRPFRTTACMQFETCLLFFFTVCSCRRLCTLLGHDISSYKAKDMQWLEFLYYIEPITKASTERTKFGPLLWTKLKQQVLLTPLTQETLYYLSAFWWTRQLREVTGFSPSQEIFAVTFNHVCARKKKQPPNTFPMKLNANERISAALNEFYREASSFTCLCFA